MTKRKVKPAPEEETEKAVESHEPPDAVHLSIEQAVALARQSIQRDFAPDLDILALPLHSFGAGIPCKTCGHTVNSVHAATVQEARKGLGVCDECARKPATHGANP